MVITEAIILAGGLGTRLRSAVPDLPKCMAPVAGKPFVSYVIDYYLRQGIQKFIFSLGYKAEVILEHLKDRYQQLEYDFVIEEEPLGTGGAIKLACTRLSMKDALVLNGDTIFKVNLRTISDIHLAKGSDCTLALKPMEDFDRYGVVELFPDASIKSFREKQHYDSGLINGGVYALNAEQFAKETLPEKFSFEKDYLEKLFDKRPMFATIQEQYFIDIGIPADYEKAKIDFLTF